MITVNFDQGPSLVFAQADSYEIIPAGHVRIFKMSPDTIDVQYAAVAPGWRSLVVEHPSPPPP